MTQCNTYAVLARYGHNGSSLADALGVNQAPVSRWATRGVPIDQLARVCAVLGCRPDELRPECVEIDGVWMAPAAAVIGEVTQTTSKRSRIAQWAQVLKLLKLIGVPLKWVPIDKITEPRKRRSKLKPSPAINTTEN